MRARGSSQTAGSPLPSRLLVHGDLSVVRCQCERRTVTLQGEAQGPPGGVVHPCQSVPTSVKKWRSTADSSGRRLGTQPDATRRKVWQAGGSRSGDVGFGGGEMALEAHEKPPFGAIFRQFSCSFHRVFRRPGPKARKLVRIQPRKALVLSVAQKRPFPNNTRFVSTGRDRCRVVAGLCEAGRGRRPRLQLPVLRRFETSLV
jgi:hypothetical protein